MPGYQRALQRFMLPEFERPAPREWVARLREISPEVEKLAHLRFRWFEPHPIWNFGERGQWSLYACTPRALFAQTPEGRARAAEFDLHWSEVALKPESDYPDSAQQARKSVVSSYQHYMWHACGVEAMPFMILQGDFGGTPAAYTRREKRLLDASDALSTPLPLGFLPACPFDERTVESIQIRDRFLQWNKDLDALAASDSPRAIARRDDEAESDFRDRFLDRWCETNIPQAEFLKSHLRTKEADHEMRRATREEANRVSQWRDIWRDTGKVIGAGIAASSSSDLPFAAVGGAEF
jgi:hypothetical protein